MKTRVPSLTQGGFHDLLGDTLDLDIHLQRGHTRFCSGDFEIHITEVIFITQDIGQHGETIVLKYETHRNTRDRRFQGDPGIHQRQTGTTHRCHRRRPIRFRNFGHNARCIRPVLGFRQHRGNPSSSQATMTDLPTLGPAYKTGFTDTIGREIVVQHKGISIRTLQSVNNRRVSHRT